MKTILFDAPIRKFILDTFGKSVNSDGLVVEKNKPKQLVLTPNGEEIDVNQFGGIKKGSEIFIKSDLISLINLYDSTK